MLPLVRFPKGREAVVYALISALLLEPCVVIRAGTLVRCGLVSCSDT